MLHRALLLLIICALSQKVLSFCDNRAPVSYKEACPKQWTTFVNETMVEYLPESWTCRARSVYTAALLVDDETKFDYCYGVYKWYAHVWVEIPGHKLDSAIPNAELNKYRTFIRLRVRGDGFLARVFTYLRSRLLEEAL